MNNDKKFLPYVEFYISHTCNFGCEGCNRFNNYTFTGHQRWKDYEKIYKEWSHRLEFNHYTIIGGEPMSNPDMIEWILGLHELWPDCNAVLLTNGSYINKFTEEFYTALLETNTLLNIGLHNFFRTQPVLQTVIRFLKHPLDIKRFPKDLNRLPGFAENWKKSYSQIKDSSWPDCNSYEEWNSLPDDIKQECEIIHKFSPDIIAEERKGYRIQDANGVKVEINYENFFHQGALIKQPDKNNFRLHNSDPIKAHDICHSKYCHHFMYGKLSKCGQSVLFAEFDQQFELDLTDSDKNLVYSYKPATLDMSDNDLGSFIDNIKNPIDQCKFCPERYTFQEIHSVTKKNKYGKKKG